VNGSGLRQSLEIPTRTYPSENSGTLVVALAWRNQFSQKRTSPISPSKKWWHTGTNQQQHRVWNRVLFAESML